MAKLREGRPGALYMAVGAAVRAQRDLRGLKQEDLAQIVGLSRASVANIEGGRQAVPIHMLAEIAEALGTTCAELLRSAESRPKRGERTDVELPTPVLTFVRRNVRAVS